VVVDRDQYVGADTAVSQPVRVDGRIYGVQHPLCGLRAGIVLSPRFRGRTLLGLVPRMWEARQAAFSGGSPERERIAGIGYGRAHSCDEANSRFCPAAHCWAMRDSELRAVGRLVAGGIPRSAGRYGPASSTLVS
jgi:hypothetical protein